MSNKADTWIFGICFVILAFAGCKFYQSLNERGPKIVEHIDDAAEKLGPLETSATHAMGSADWAASSTAELAQSLKATMDNINMQIKWYSFAIMGVSGGGQIANMLHRSRLAKKVSKTP